MSAAWDWIIATLAIVIPALGPAEAPGYSGYVEADYVYVAAASPGRITAVETREGAHVEAGAVLLRLDDTEQVAALHAAQASIAVARANLENLRTGSRADEVAVVRATLHRAEADQRLAATTLARSEKLLERDLVPSAQVDAERAAMASADAYVAQLRAQLRVAELPARDAQVVGAEAALNVARAEAERAQARLADRTITSPISGLVERVFFDPGEVAAIGTPILSLFQPSDLHVVFFVPERDRARLRLGSTLTVTCDACDGSYTAELTRIAADPQFTPPIIYSRAERHRLVFLAEARLKAPDGLLPGQPITVLRTDD